MTSRREFTKALSLIGIVSVLPTLAATAAQQARLLRVDAGIDVLDYVLIDLDKVQFTKIDVGGKDNMELYIDFWVPSENRIIEKVLMEALSAWSENFGYLKAKVVGWSFPAQGIRASIVKASLKYPGRSHVDVGVDNPTIIGLTLLYEGEWNDA